MINPGDNIILDKIAVANATMDRGNATIWVGDGFLNLLEPNIEVMNIENLAHGLAKKDRASGFYNRVFSVAEHSILSSRIANEICKSKVMSESDTNIATLETLLHDGSESYLIDMPRPIKHHPRMEIFRDVEDEMQFHVNNRFLGYLNMKFKDIVKQADNEALMFEFWTYMENSRTYMPWCNNWDAELIDKSVKGLPFISKEIPWRKARSLFINEYDMLNNRLAKGNNVSYIR